MESQTQLLNYSFTFLFCPLSLLSIYYYPLSRLRQLYFSPFSTFHILLPSLPVTSAVLLLFFYFPYTTTLSSVYVSCTSPVSLLSIYYYALPGYISYTSPLSVLSIYYYPLSRLRQLYFSPFLYFPYTTTLSPGYVSCTSPLSLLSIYYYPLPRLRQLYFSPFCTFHILLPSLPVTSAVLLPFLYFPYSTTLSPGYVSCTSPLSLLSIYYYPLSQLRQLYSSPFCTFHMGPSIKYVRKWGGGGGGFKSPIHFHCVLHAKRGGGGPDSM